MNALFLISVGGSGTRVIESLVHMLAMGGSTQHWPEEIHVLLMEMDSSNGNFVRVEKLLSEYAAMHEACSGLDERNRFFRPVIKPYYWHPSPTQDIQRQSLRTLVDSDAEAQILCSLLFTEAELEMTVEQGFKGRPALGVAYFDQMSPLGEPEENSDVSRFFEALERKGQGGEQGIPRVLVISSCHGGTGATGIPALEQQLHKRYRNDPIHLGLLLMLPTFSVPPATTDNQTPIDSDTFTDKVKTVFSYYAQQGFFYENRNKGYRWTYLLGYQEPIPFTHYSEGSESQNNPCTVFDWYATIAIHQFYAGQDGAEPEPGIYIASIPPTPWNFQRFETVFPTIATDVTAMLHASIIFQKVLLPDLQRLCGDGSNGVETYAQRLFHMPYLHDFYPGSALQVSEAAILQTFAPFAEYTASLIQWLYDIASHTPTDYPERFDAELAMQFHGLPEDSREALKEAFAQRQSEETRSLIRQQFVNAPYLHKARTALQNGGKARDAHGKRAAKETDALAKLISKAADRLNEEHKLSILTQQTGTPPLQMPHVLGELWDHRPATTPQEGADPSTWTLLMALLMTVQAHHPITYKGKARGGLFMKAKEKRYAENA